MKNPLTLLFAIGLASCGPPKAIIVAEAPVVKPKVETPVIASTVPAVPREANDGLRLPDDMLALPDDDQLRSSANPSAGGGAPIITRPPKE